MKAKTCILCLASAAMGFMLAGIPQSRTSGQENAANAGRVKWEYKMLAHSEDRLNAAGNDGWELVTIEHRENLGNVAYLKRSKL
jgi:hypothetical protein